MKMEAVVAREKKAFQGSQDAWNDYLEAMRTVVTAVQGGAGDGEVLELPEEHHWSIFVSDGRILEWAKAIREG